MLKIGVVTVSDRASSGDYKDLSGKTIEQILSESFDDIQLEYRLTPDSKAELEQAIQDLLDMDWILTTGGTGIGPRDITPETVEDLCDREIPGISEILRSKSYEQTPNAMLSRGYAGVCGSTIIVTLPGSPKAVSFCTEILIPVLEHGTRMIKGKGH